MGVPVEFEEALGEVEGERALEVEIPRVLCRRQVPDYLVAMPDRLERVMRVQDSNTSLIRKRPP